MLSSAPMREERLERRVSRLPLLETCDCRRLGALLLRRLRLRESELSCRGFSSLVEALDAGSGLELVSGGSCWWLVAGCGEDGTWSVAGTGVGEAAGGDFCRGGDAGSSLVLVGFDRVRSGDCGGMWCALWLCCIGGVVEEDGCGAGEDGERWTGGKLRPESSFMSPFSGLRLDFA